MADTQTITTAVVLPPVAPIAASTSTETVALPPMDASKIADIVKNNSATIDANMEQAQVKAQEVEEFLQKSLNEIFASQNQTVTAVGDLFKQVVNVDEVKQSLKDMINTFAIEKSDVIGKTITEVDDSLSTINPFVKTARNAIENGVGFWKGVFGGSAKQEITEALQGLAGRIDSLSDVFNQAKASLDANEVLLGQLLPKVGFRIAKLEGMAKALTVINQGVTHEPTKQMIASLISEFTNLAVLQRDSLARLLLLTVMNGNSKLVLQATEVEVFVTLEPLIGENIIGGEQVKVYDLRAKTRAGLAKLRDNSVSNIEKIMALSEQEKVDLKKSMEDAASRIENMMAKAKQHEDNMAVAQKAIDDYAPVLAATVENLDKKIKDYAETQKTSADATSKIMQSMVSQTSDLKTLAKA